MKTRALFAILGFQKDWGAITDQRPAYFYDFGNLRLTAAEVMSDQFKPCFHLGGVIQDARSITMIDFEMPLEVESFEQGVAWISYGIRKITDQAFRQRGWTTDALGRTSCRGCGGWGPTKVAPSAWSKRTGSKSPSRNCVRCRTPPRKTTSYQYRLTEKF